MVEMVLLNSLSWLGWRQKLALSVSEVLCLSEPPQLSLLVFPEVRPGPLQGWLHAAVRDQVLQVLPPDHPDGLDQAGPRPGLPPRLLRLRLLRQTALHWGGVRAGLWQGKPLRLRCCANDWLVTVCRFSVRVTIWSWWREATAPPRTETPVRAPRTTTEIKIENPNGIEQLLLMSRFTFFKQIFKLIAIRTVKI